MTLELHLLAATQSNSIPTMTPSSGQDPMRHRSKTPHHPGHPERSAQIKKFVKKSALRTICFLLKRPKKKNTWLLKKK